MSLTHCLWESHGTPLYLLSSPEEWNTVVMKAVGHGGISKKSDSVIKEFKSFVLYRIKLKY